MPRQRQNPLLAVTKIRRLRFRYFQLATSLVRAFLATLAPKNSDEFSRRLSLAPETLANASLKATVELCDRKQRTRLKCRLLVLESPRSAQIDCAPEDASVLAAVASTARPTGRTERRA